VPGDTIVVMTSGDYGGLHDKVLLKLGDPGAPGPLADKQGISQLLNRVASPTRCWGRSGRTTW
jgi:hypothetical protein